MRGPARNERDMRLPQFLVALICACAIVLAAVLAGPAAASDSVDWKWRKPLQPCNGDCRFTVFGGAAIGTNVQDIFFKGIGPTGWRYDPGGIVGATAGRRVATVFDIIDIEAEIGAAKRLGNMDEGEFWGAMYVRYTAFPWNRFVYTTLGLSTGLNYATGVSDFENQVSERNPPQGTRLQHYFAPELTFALPDHKESQLVVRLHHRSGAYGVVSPAMSGASYITVGIRQWF